MNENIVVELKEVLNINNWSEIKTFDQFYYLVSYMYSLDQKTNREIVNSIDNLEMLIEEFFNVCIDLVIDYEPTIMVALVDINEILMDIFSEDNTPESKNKIAYELTKLSEWLMVDSKVKYKGKRKAQDSGKYEEESFVVSVFTVLTMLREKINNNDKSEFKLYLIKDKRKSLLIDLQDLVNNFIDFSDDEYFMKNNLNEYEFDELDDDYYLN